MWETKVEGRRVKKLIEVGCPLDRNVISTEEEKAKRYVPMKEELERMDPGTRVEIVTIVIGNTGLISKETVRNLDSLNIRLKAEALQKTAAIQTVKIVRNHTGRGEPEGQRR